MANSIDWVWFGKGTHVLIKVQQLIMHIRAKTKPWGQKKQSVELRKQVCVKPHIWGRVQKKILLHWRVTEACSLCYLNGRSLKQPGFFLELASWPNWANCGEGLWLEWWRRTWCHSSWAPWSYMQIEEIYRRTNTTANTPSIWALWQCGKTQSSLQCRHMKTPKGPSDCEK